MGVVGVAVATGRGAPRQGGPQNGVEPPRPVAEGPTSGLAAVLDSDSFTEII